jgi:hypothetical protein
MERLRERNLPLLVNQADDKEQAEHNPGQG